MRVHGNYSQITGEEGMISATMDTREGVRKRVYVHKIKKEGRNFQGKVYFDFCFK